MAITATDLRTVKEFICDTVAAISGVGEVLPTRKTFASKEEYFATVNALTTQKDIETEAAAFALIYMLRPWEAADAHNEKIFYTTYVIDLFRETFQTRVDETATPDAFEKKILLTEDTFDAAAINIGQAFREPLGVGNIQDSNMTATTLVVQADDDITWGTPEYLQGAEGSFIRFLIPVEIVYDDC